MSFYWNYVWNILDSQNRQLCCFLQRHGQTHDHRNGQTRFVKMKFYISLGIFGQYGWKQISFIKWLFYRKIYVTKIIKKGEQDVSKNGNQHDRDVL